MIKLSDHSTAVAIVALRQGQLDDIFGRGDDVDRFIEERLNVSDADLAEFSPEEVALLRGALVSVCGNDYDEALEETLRDGGVHCCDDMTLERHGRELVSWIDTKLMLREQIIVQTPASAFVAKRAGQSFECGPGFEPELAQQLADTLELTNGLRPDVISISAGPGEGEQAPAAFKIRDERLTQRAAPG